MRLFCSKTCKFCDDSDRCANTKCPWNKKCFLDKNNQPTCKCSIEHCSAAKNTGEICTTSGRTFSNLCALLSEECESGKVFQVAHYGGCLMMESCVDSKRELQFGLCDSWKGHGFCERVPNVMKKYCAKTCNLCVQHSPPKCESSTFGCCWWQKDTSAKGPKGEGCRTCIDLDFCAHFMAQCGRPSNRVFMKKNCPKTCHYCTSDIHAVP